MNSQTPTPCMLMVSNVLKDAFEKNIVSFSVPEAEQSVTQQQVLEPLREHYGKAIHVNSGYRCPRLNKLVGGADNSQHMKGEAADLFLPSVKIGWEWYQWIQEHCKNYDQLILERNSKGGWWIHVCCCRDTRMNRKQFFEKIKRIEKNKG